MLGPKGILWVSCVLLLCVFKKITKLIVVWRKTIHWLTGYIVVKSKATHCLLLYTVKVHLYGGKPAAVESCQPFCHLAPSGPVLVCSQLRFATALFFPHCRGIYSVRHCTVYHLTPRARPWVHQAEVETHFNVCTPWLGEASAWAYSLRGTGVHVPCCLVGLEFMYLAVRWV